MRCVKEPTLEISEDEFVFEAVPGSSQTLQVRTDYQQGWKATVRDSENSTSVSTTSWLKIADADETARYTLSGPGGETFHDITLTAEVYNNTVTHREAWIHITAGSTTLKVRVTQDSLVVSPRYAPPGVIGVIEGTNTLTLKGSKEYAISPNDKEYADDYLGGLENKTVYVVYFKFGSLVAISSDPTDNASPYLESDDIIEWPVEYTDTAWISAPDWEDIPSYTPEDYDYPNKRNVSHVDYHNPENFALGKGDPCMYYFGSKHGGGWHLPSDIVRVPTWMTGWYAADGVEVDFPAPGRRKSLRFYPAAGDRTGTGRVMRQGTSGRYWSPTTRDDDDSEVLYFSEEHVRPEGGGANTRMFSQHTVGHIVRCAR